MRRFEACIARACMRLRRDSPKMLDPHAALALPRCGSSYRSTRVLIEVGFDQPTSPFLNHSHIYFSMAVLTDNVQGLPTTAILRT
jgi:hypothetical protein